LESAGRTLVCSVLFLDIADYSQRPVAEQLQLKQAFNQALAAALEQVAARDRIILDTGDGAAITFMGDPEDALFAAMAMRDLAASVPVRLGVNLGPVRLVKDLNSQMNIIGDGINVAQRVMSFSRPGQLLVSRSFYEVVSCLSRDYASLFRHEGSRTDKHVRAHEVYAVVGATPAPMRLDQVEASAETNAPGAVGWLKGTGPFGLRHSALLAAPLLFLLIIAGGVGARAVMPEPVVAKPAPAKPVVKPLATPVEPPVAAPAGGGAAAPEEQRQKKLVARVEKNPESPAVEKPAAAAPKGPGRLEIAVAPWGDVLVDGKKRGRTPPLLVIDVPAGAHTIEIRNATSPAHTARVEVKPGETIRIQHRFR
jgi:class 3 adenylate cyclase